MLRFRRFLPLASLLLAVALFEGAPRAQTPAAPAAASPRPTAPRQTAPMAEWGHNIGDDYFLVNYQQLIAYWKKLEKESPRLKVVDIGKSSEGRPMLMAIITSPANHQKLARYKTIASRLANAEGLTDDAARALAKEGKAVVWIDGGLHATETLGAQQLLEHVWQMVSRTDAGDPAHPGRRDSAVRAGQSGRHGSRVRLVHAARQHEHPRPVPTSTPATTTTATSTWRPSPSPRTSIA